MGNQKLMIIWVWMLLVASLYPWVHCRRGGGDRGNRGKSSSMKGLKLAGAAAAGALGGAAIGYGLGSRYGYGYEEQGRRYYPDGPGYHNRSDWKYNWNTGSSQHMASILLTLGTVGQIFMWE